MIKPLMTTNKGYKVAGCQPTYNPTTNSYSGISGRVRVVKDDPSKDEYCKWDSNNAAINHSYGALNAEISGEDAEVNGFNFFGGLR